MADIAELLKRGLISAGAYAKRVGGNIADVAMYPGKVMQAGARGEPFDLQGAADWSAGTALGMAGVGSPFAQRGTLGMTGGKISAPQLDRLRRASTGIDTLSGPQKPVSELSRRGLIRLKPVPEGYEGKMYYELTDEGRKIFEGLNAEDKL